MKFDITTRVVHRLHDDRAQRILASWRLYLGNPADACTVLPEAIRDVFKNTPNDASDEAVLRAVVSDHLAGRIIGGVLRGADDTDVERVRAEFVPPPKEPPADTQVLVLNPPNRSVKH